MKIIVHFVDDVLVDWIKNFIITPGGFSALAILFSHFFLNIYIMAAIHFSGIWSNIYVKRVHHSYVSGLSLCIYELGISFLNLFITKTWILHWFIWWWPLLKHFSSLNLKYIFRVLISCYILWIYWDCFWFFKEISILRILSNLVYRLMKWIIGFWLKWDSLHRIWLYFYYTRNS